MPSPDPRPNQPARKSEPAAASSENQPEILVDLTRRDDAKVSTAYAEGTGRKIAVFAVIVAAGLACSFFIVQMRKSGQESELESQTATAAEAPAVVEVAHVSQGAGTQSLNLPGQTRAWYESTIYARINGYLAQWKADIGDRVSKDSVLATIDTPELDQQLIAAQAKLKVSEAETTVTEANSDFAKSTYERWRDSPAGVVSEQERQEKKADYDSSVAKLDAAKSQVNLDQAMVDQLSELAKFKEVRAPFDGIITARRIDIGDLITAGSSSSTTSLYSIAQFDQIRVFVDVPENVSAEMTTGTAATITASEYPDRVFQGAIARTTDSIDPASSTMKVELDVPNSDLALRPGMYVQVNFKVQQKPLLEIPASALIFRSSGPQVAVVGDDGKVHFHSVTIAHEQGEVVQIASGISAQDKVALNISGQIADGDKVAPVEAGQAPAAKPSP